MRNFTGRPSFEKIFRTFKKEVEKERIMQELRKHEYYEKPSKTRRRKKGRRIYPESPE
ncbi:MAG: 30S ribosomal protein S21 [bacterium (Candidatus Ratteibacteria) CG_4_10_14_3_um_filter_41_18]|uniref:30S ribosomal protein S21 n=4 Tax=Candidatus Ratteibacteria TaxID=2979319 RepID=A0A2M7E836_9BACT|nr:MAG: 30S ribosomal protein S21 [Candidatus Omnitrophica bacterium CG1_02_41_171]PIV63902.1 MAG: 30S ribosomal protein S21 [bacterium (Candidatus Ratteibacteria) CG01_land_8_20_14_3_00_40_19]PIW32275.1 MAG: 30S ribosomal protein S21 [bacterium (Candidatus Ratteibacteria) CG15_BIG_FIL_POST_REV_8_21_14_020_41_12]PIW74263.1 MAG: 30S ribosomal protein S21 [bacterium (Candidatus Ratteibacteria) CG_4_8_14_3_um_filter_41_36]PIX77870.1 MAG: 30S ribosomal protein S21 [bacterium (Candidatus Ratteibacte